MTSKEALKILNDIAHGRHFNKSFDYAQALNDRISRDLDQLVILKKIIENIHPKLLIIDGMKCIQIGFYYFCCTPDLAGIIENLDYWEEAKIHHEINYSKQADKRTY